MGYVIYTVYIYICRYNILGGAVDITFMAITTVNKTPIAWYGAPRAPKVFYLSTCNWNCTSKYVDICAMVK
jgi:hypothetical protein